MVSRSCKTINTKFQAWKSNILGMTYRSSEDTTAFWFHVTSLHQQKFCSNSCIQKQSSEIFTDQLAHSPRDGINYSIYNQSNYCFLPPNLVIDQLTPVQTSRGQIWVSEARSFPWFNLQRRRHHPYEFQNVYESAVSGTIVCSEDNEPAGYPSWSGKN